MEIGSMDPWLFNMVLGKKKPNLNRKNQHNKILKIKLTVTLSSNDKVQRKNAFREKHVIQSKFETDVLILTY